VDYEIVTSFDENYETRGVSSKFKSATSRFLDYCIIYFIDNTYFVDNDKRRIVSQESTNILREGKDQNMSLKEESGEEENEEPKRQYMEGWDPPTSPSKNDSSYLTQDTIFFLRSTQDTIIMHEQPSYEPTITDGSYYYCDECAIEPGDESPDMPISDIVPPN
jgi:hypothetical protein